MDFKKGYTHIAIVLDRSGSMETLVKETISNYNHFIEEQKTVPGEATVTLVQFDHEYTPVYGMLPLKSVEPLTQSTYVPRGYTALWDAIGTTVNSLGQKLRAMPPTQRPEKVIVVIITDGLENSSREYSAERLREIISHQQQKYKWQFVFLGANQDAVLKGSEIGIAMASSLSVGATAAGLASSYGALSRSTKNFRLDSAEAINFTQEDRIDQVNAGAAVDSSFAGGGGDGGGAGASGSFDSGSDSNSVGS